MARGPYPDDFFGFTEVPYHPHLGVTFTRETPDAPALVTVPASELVTEPGGRQSAGALFTAAEVGGAMAACDHLLPHAEDILETMRPTMLTVGGRLTCHSVARGDIRADCTFIGDEAAAVARLRRVRKVTVTIGVRLIDGDEVVAADAELRFYVRLMEESRLRAMATMVTGGKSKEETTA